MRDLKIGDRVLVLGKEGTLVEYTTWEDGDIRDCKIKYGLLSEWVYENLVHKIISK